MFLIWAIFVLVLIAVLGEVAAIWFFLFRLPTILEEYGFSIYAARDETLSARNQAILSAEEVAVVTGVLARRFGQLEQRLQQVETGASRSEKTGEGRVAG